MMVIISLRVKTSELHLQTAGSTIKTWLIRGVLGIATRKLRIISCADMQCNKSQ